MARVTPGFVGGRNVEAETLMGWGESALRIGPIAVLILVVLGGICPGWTRPVEAGAAGSLLGIVIAALRRRINWSSFRETVIETGHITAAILFPITAASMYARMLGLARPSNALRSILAENQVSLFWIMVLVLFLGTILNTASIILIVGPQFLPLCEALGLSLVWVGIVAAVAAEIGLLIPPPGLSCFVIKATPDDERIKLKDVFLGALPFALVMLLVLVLLIRFPAFRLAILN